MEVTKLNRKFRVTIKGKSIELDDPNPDFTIYMVKEHYSGIYPELTNASFGPPKVENENIVYEIESNPGTKG